MDIWKRFRKDAGNLELILIGRLFMLVLIGMFLKKYFLLIFRRFDSLAPFHRQFQQWSAVRVHPVSFQLFVSPNRCRFHDGDLLVADKRARSVLGNDARPHCRLH